MLRRFLACAASACSGAPLGGRGGGRRWSSGGPSPARWWAPRPGTIRDALLFALGCLVGTQLRIFCWVEGRSMAPTLAPGELMLKVPCGDPTNSFSGQLLLQLLQRWSGAGSAAEALRGRVVVAKVKADGTLVCKRVGAPPVLVEDDDEHHTRHPNSDGGGEAADCAEQQGHLAAVGPRCAAYVARDGVVVVLDSFAAPSVEESDNTAAWDARDGSATEMTLAAAMAPVERRLIAELEEVQRGAAREVLVEEETDRGVRSHSAQQQQQLLLREEKEEQSWPSKGEAPRPRSSAAEDDLQHVDDSSSESDTTTTTTTTAAAAAAAAASSSAAGLAREQHYMRQGEWAWCFAQEKAHSHARGQGGFLWLLGDNPTESLDSRAVGDFPLECLRGLPIAVVWPPTHARFIA